MSDGFRQCAAHQPPSDERPTLNLCRIPSGTVTAMPKV